MKILTDKKRAEILHKLIINNMIVNGLYADEIENKEEAIIKFIDNQCQVIADICGVNGLIVAERYLGISSIEQQISETEIKSMTKEQNYMRGYADGKSDVLDKIREEVGEEICLTDNTYTGETTYTIEHLRLLEILDDIGKSESEE